MSKNGPICAIRTGVAKAILAFILAVAVSGLSGCSSKGETADLTQSDMDMTVSEIAASLARSDFLTERNKNSAPIVIMIEKVENQTAEVIKPAEQWMMMARVCGSPQVAGLFPTKNVTFQIPPERWQLLSEPYRSQPPTVRATHTMTAIFRTAVRDARNQAGFVNAQTRHNMLQYQITDLTSRKILWQDEVLISRQAKGLLID